MADVTYIPVDVIERFMMDVFRGLGAPEDDARICADVLIAVLTQQKYNDAAVKDFFRKAAAELPARGVAAAAHPPQGAPRREAPRPELDRRTSTCRSPNRGSASRPGRVGRRAVTSLRPLP